MENILCNYKSLSIWEEGQIQMPARGQELGQAERLKASGAVKGRRGVQDA